MASWQAGDVATNGIRLHYTRTGGAKPTVVLAHGFSDDGLCWTPVAEVLAPDYDVIMIDARGHGLSEAPANGYGPAEHSADLAGAIVALGLRRPAVLGHSMGAATALALAGTYPDLAGAILLEDPPAWWVAASQTDTEAAVKEHMAQQRIRLAGMKSKTREELLAAQHAAMPGWSEAELGPWADAKLRFNLSAMIVGPTTSIDWPATLARITCPALLITADPAQGAIITDESAASLQSLVPQLRVAHIPGAGHNIRRDQFERYTDIVRGFLRELEGQS
jgi:pimeloyl-ACP methyl ester carboxylesterase